MKNINEKYDSKECFGIAVAMEAKRLSEKYNKDTFDCNDIMKILGVGEANVRKLMNSKDFPTIEIGNRRVVTALNFSIWMVHNYISL